MTLDICNDNILKLYIYYSKNLFLVFLTDHHEYYARKLDSDKK